ncbi:MAG: diguanylate cyclase [Polyangiaceae bacterium]
MSRESALPPSVPPSTRAHVPTILVVDDDEALLRLVTSWLEASGMATLEATGGQAALDIATRHAPTIDAIVLDVMMPGIDGHETLRRLKAQGSTREIPVVVLTAHANRDQDIIRGVERGAVDHLPKPFSGPVLVAKVRAAAERGRIERRLRADLRFAEENASVDVLTRLWNRRHFDDALKREAARSLRHAKPFTVVLFDLDHFKAVNDTYGHPEGDRVLVHFAETLRSVARASDAAFRYGGEEFVVTLTDATVDDGVQLAGRLRQALVAVPFQFADGTYRPITFSAGVASLDEENGFVDEALLLRADQALYRAKRAGRDRTERASREVTKSEPS